MVHKDPAVDAFVDATGPGARLTSAPGDSIVLRATDPVDVIGDSDRQRGLFAIYIVSSLLPRSLVRRHGVVWCMPSVIGSGLWLVSTKRPPRRCETLDGARSGNVIAANQTRACYRPYRGEFDDETDGRRITQSQRIGHAGGGISCVVRYARGPSRVRK